MYIPKKFAVTDFKEVKNFIENNAFATIVTIDNGVPVASHLPILLRKFADGYYVTGHFALQNPQWKTIEQNNRMLAIFHGPHAYVSASWYTHENVSTWNYQSVHVYGKAWQLTEAELEEDLKLLLQKYEFGRENAVLWENLSENTKKQINGVVGFKMKIEEVQAAYKLSQNRNSVDYERIIHALHAEADAQSIHVAKAMEKIKKNND